MKKTIMLMLMAVVLAFSACTNNASIEDERMCTMEYNPVCGVDGVTYGNACVAGDVEIAHQGECVENGTSENHSEMEHENGDMVVDTTNGSDEVVVELDAFNFGYSVSEIRVKQGQTVKVVMTNTQGNHDFVIDELDVKTPIIRGGETTEVEFVASETGEFEFYCSVGSHRANGMFGKFIVEE